MERGNLYGGLESELFIGIIKRPKNQSSELCKYFDLFVCDKLGVLIRQDEDEHVTLAIGPITGNLEDIYEGRVGTVDVDGEFILPSSLEGYVDDIEYFIEKSFVWHGVDLEIQRMTYSQACFDQLEYLSTLTDPLKGVGKLVYKMPSGMDIEFDIGDTLRNLREKAYNFKPPIYTTEELLEIIDSNLPEPHSDHIPQKEVGHYKIQILGPKGPVEGATFWVGDEQTTDTIFLSKSDSEGFVHIPCDKIIKLKTYIIRIRDEFHIPFEVYSSFLESSGIHYYDIIEDKLY